MTANPSTIASRLLAAGSFRRRWRDVLLRTIWIFLLADTVRAQPSLTFQSTPVESDTGILQVLTADFNGDGNADLVFLSAFRLTVALGNGDGTFQSPIHTPATGNFQFATMAVGDFNHDGKVDVVVLGTAGSAGGTPFVETYLGLGDGTLSAPVNSASDSFVSNPSVADVNHDGKLDLIGPGTIALGVGDGTFTVAVATTPCQGGTDVAVADFNGDGNPDVSILNATTSGGGFIHIENVSVTACLGNGDGTFASGSQIYGTDSVSATVQVPEYLITMGDFDGDGKADAAVFYENADGQPISFSYSVIFGNGHGSFKPPVTGAAFRSSASSLTYFPKPVVVDMNGDGKSDLVQTQGSAGVSVFLSNGDGTFTDAADLSPGQTPVSIAVADFNHDGLRDIVSTGSSSTSILINTTRAIDSVLNAASFATGQPVAPGSLVAIFGAGIGPVTAVSSVSTTESLAGVSVTFNGIAAPLLYVSAQQINAQVPWEVNGEVEVIVTFNGFAIGPFKVATAPIAPGVFATASGQAAAFNQDGSIAGATGAGSHPAAAGDTLTVYANGLGPVTPSIADGVASGNTVRMAGSTPVFIGGVACDVTFAGLSSTLVGVNQLSVVVPTGVHGVVPLEINAGGIVTTSRVTVAIQ